LLNQTGVAVIGAEVVEEGALEIEQVFVSEVSAFLREFPTVTSTSARADSWPSALMHGKVSNLLSGSRPRSRRARPEPALGGRWRRR
jgi:hypothetical protein